MKQQISNIDSVLKPLLEVGKYQTAIKFLDEAIASHPNNEMAYMQKGICLRSLGKAEEAIKCFNKAISLNSKFPEAFYQKGSAFNELGKDSEAIKCYDFAILLNPKYTEALNNKGIILSDQGKHTEALACFDKAISINEKFADAFYNKGLTLASLGQNEEAIKFYDKAIEMTPNDSTIHNNKGVALRDLEKFQEAIVSFEKAISLCPDYAMAFNNKGNTLKSLGKNKEAIECFDKAISLNPKYPTAINNKGVTLYESGQKQEAIKCFDQVISLNPKYANALNNMGICLYDLRKMEEALLCYNKAITINPDESLFLCNRALIFNIQEKTAETIADFTKAFELTKSNNTRSIKNLNETLKLIVELLDVASKTDLAAQDFDENKKGLFDYMSSLNGIHKQKNKVIKEIIESYQKTVRKNEHKKQTTNLNKLIKKYKELNEIMAEIIEEESHASDLTSIDSLNQINEERSYRTKVETFEFLSKLREELDGSSLSKEEASKILEYFGAFVETFASIYFISQLVGYEQVRLDSKMFKAHVFPGMLSLCDCVDTILFNGKMDIYDLIEHSQIKQLTKKVIKIAKSQYELTHMIEKIAFDIAVNLEKQQAIIRVNEKDMEKDHTYLRENLFRICYSFDPTTKEELYPELFKSPAAQLGHYDANLLVKVLVFEKINNDNVPEEFLEKIIGQKNQKEVSTAADKEESSPPTELFKTEVVSRHPCCNVF